MTVDSSKSTLDLERVMFQGLIDGENTWSQPLNTVPCANVKLALLWKCDKPGLYACAGCRLVSYCSRRCQGTHWPFHKRDCQNKMNDKNWLASWLTQRREPEFARSGEPKYKSHGTCMWGNLQALDILNLPLNESLSYTGDLSIAFIAAGDLRNLIQTVNGIPLSYTGKLNFLINDMEGAITIRNFLLLRILAEVENQALAVDIALHFWYSAYLPQEYVNRIAMLGVKNFNNLDDFDVSKPFDMRTRCGARITCEVTKSMVVAWLFYTHDLEFDEKIAAQKRQEALFHPDRADYHERYLTLLEPPHRLAIQKFRKDGILLPFGAATDHFSVFNRTLASGQGDWLLNDSISPMDGWNKSAVLSTRRRHKAKEEDVVGCYYFYISDQLRQFVTRLHKFDIVFHLAAKDCCDLADDLRTAAIPSSSPPTRSLPLQYDRIDVSNVVDYPYVGFEQVFQDWAPRLNINNPFATMLVCTMTWAQTLPGVEPENDQEYEATFFNEMFEKKRFWLDPLGLLTEEWGPSTNILWRTKPARYDNSAFFDKFLEVQRVEQSASSAGLKLKSPSTVVPYRIGVPVKAPRNTVPEYPNNKCWYREVHLSRSSLYERFLEFSLAAQ